MTTSVGSWGCSAQTMFADRRRSSKSSNICGKRDGRFCSITTASLGQLLDFTQPHGLDGLQQTTLSQTL